MPEVKTFTDFFKEKVLQDRLPFNIDFEIQTIKSDITEKIAGYDLKVKKDLTSSENWFFETIETLNLGKVTEAQLLLNSLVSEFRITFNCKDAAEAQKFLFKIPKKISATPEYEAFSTAHLADIRKLNEMMSLAQDPRSINWLTVTFIMKTRSDVNWSMGDTGTLSDAEIKEILDFVAKEANGGIKPEPVKELIVEEGKETEDQKEQNE